MRTKEELTKKRGKSSEQLDLVNTISAADKLKHKRRWLYFALFVTIGLSLIFWLYRSLKTLSFPKSLPEININFHRSASNQLELSTQLSTLLSQHPDIVGLYLSHDHPSRNLNYGNISDINLAALKTTVTSQPRIPNSPTVALLPEGVVCHEHFDTSGGQTVFSSLITNPIDQIFIVIRFNGSPDSLKSFLPGLVSAAYWSASSN
jgi:hypothetical protein